MYYINKASQVYLTGFTIQNAPIHQHPNPHCAVRRTGNLWNWFSSIINTEGKRDKVIDTDNTQLVSDSDSEIGLISNQEKQELSGDALIEYFQKVYDIHTDIHTSTTAEGLIQEELDFLVSLVDSDGEKLPSDYEAQYRAWRPESLPADIQTQPNQQQSQQTGGQQQTPPQQQTSGSSDPDMAEIEQAMKEQLLKDREEAKANGANFGGGDPLSNEDIEKIGEALNTGLMP